MAFKNILSWPSQALKKKSAPVLEFDDDLRSLVGDLYDTLNVVSGVGLAAPQIGVHQRCVIIDTSQCQIENQHPIDGLPENIMAIVNPKLTLSGPKHKWMEACLSVPDSKGMVERSQHVSLEFQDISGGSHVIELDWPASGVVQHECDHLDGILYVDRMGRLSKDMLLKKIVKKRKKMAEVRKMMKAQEEKDLAAIDGTSSPTKRKTTSSKKRRKRPPKKNHLNKKRRKK